MQLTEAAWRIKNLECGPDRDEALEALRAYPFVRINYRHRWDEDYRPLWEVIEVTADDEQRADLPETLTVYRSAPPEGRQGTFWEAKRWHASAQVLGRLTPDHVMWTTTLPASDSRLLAELVTGCAGGEYLIDADSLEIQEA